jgi:DNA topoisomerase-1
VLEIGGNRAIDLIVAKESGAGQPRFGAGSGRVLGDHPTLGGAITVKQGRFGAYVNHGKINATLPKGTSTEALTLDEAVAALAAKAAGGGSDGRLLGDHPEGGAITVRPGRFGPYVNWGKVNATIPKSIPPDSITLLDAIELIAEREGKPAKAAPRKPVVAAKPAAKPKPKAAAKKAPARKVAAPKVAGKK